MRIKSEQVGDFANPDTALAVDVKIIEPRKIAQDHCSPAPKESQKPGKSDKLSNRKPSSAPEQKEERRTVRERQMKSADLAKRNRNVLQALIKAHPEMARQLWAQRQKMNFAAA